MLLYKPFIEGLKTLIPFFKNKIFISIIHNISILLITFISYSYIIGKFFKVLCFSKMTFEWLPMINPYIWPFSFFKIITNPYFKFWSKILPSLKFEKSALDISGIIAIEALNTVVYLLVILSNRLLMFLEKTEQILRN
jgi:hypothetical protein